MNSVTRFALIGVGAIVLIATGMYIQSVITKNQTQTASTSETMPTSTPKPIVDTQPASNPYQSSAPTPQQPASDQLPDGYTQYTITPNAPGTGSSFSITIPFPKKTVSLVTKNLNDSNRGYFSATGLKAFNGNVYGLLQNTPDDWLTQLHYTTTDQSVTFPEPSSAVTLSVITDEQIKRLFEPGRITEGDTVKTRNCVNSPSQTVGTQQWKTITCTFTSQTGQYSTSNSEVLCALPLESDLYLWAAYTLTGANSDVSACEFLRSTLNIHEVTW